VPMTRSLSQPNIGDEITLRTTGRDPVEVRRTVRILRGSKTRRSSMHNRNRWVIEKTQFLMERATAAQW